MFPAQRVEITVLEPMDYNYSVRAMVRLDKPLQAIYQQRQARGIPYDGYAYGLFTHIHWGITVGQVAYWD